MLIIKTQDIPQMTIIFEEVKRCLKQRCPIYIKTELDGFLNHKVMFPFIFFDIFYL